MTTDLWHNGAVMIPWVTQLGLGLMQECGQKPWVAALATADAAGRPNVRHIILRRLDPDGTIWFTSDARSRKMDDLRHNGACEVAIWLPGLREQYRLAGPVRVLQDGPERDAMWRSLTGQTRAMFAWPHPGAARTGSQADWPKEIGPDAAVPASFAVLALMPDMVEHLNLNRVPHERRQWRLEDSWREQALNP